MSLDVLTGIDYITQHTAETMLYQAEVLMSNGTDVFNKTKGLQRYIDFFDSYDRYQKQKHPSPEQERKIIDSTPNFLEG